MCVALMSNVVVIVSISQPGYLAVNWKSGGLFLRWFWASSPALLSNLGQPFDLSEVSFLHMKAESTPVLVLCEFTVQPEWGSSLPGSQGPKMGKCAGDP